MQYEVYVALRQICERWPEHGKIIEKILAISFDDARGGFEVESRSTEGVDIELINECLKYAIEVKTTSGVSILLAEKDIKGLLSKARKDGYIPVVAVLRIQFLSDWVFARANDLVPNYYSPERLRLKSIIDLESIARLHFGRTLLELKGNILNHPGGIPPLTYLDEILARESKHVLV